MRDVVEGEKYDRSRHRWSAGGVMYEIEISRTTIVPRAQHDRRSVRTPVSYQTLGTNLVKSVAAPVRSVSNHYEICEMSSTLRIPRPCQSSCQEQDCGASYGLRGCDQWHSRFMFSARGSIS